MNSFNSNVSRRTRITKWAAGMGMALAMALPMKAYADEADAKALLKATADYMGSQTNISFSYDADLEVVTTEDQKLSLASSGTVNLQRPDKIHTTRSGGFANLESVFDGKTLSMLGKDANIYLQVEIPGSIDSLIDTLKDKYHRPLPAADLLLSNSYDQLMENVIDIKDLGSGVVGGVECDHLAFRTKEVDWQIWIAQGAEPHPCKYVITSKLIQGGPEYRIQVGDWKTGDMVKSDEFSFTPPAGATKIDMAELENLRQMNDLPSNFDLGAAK